MGIPYNEAAIPGRHTLAYRIRDSHRGYPVREIEALATPEEIQTLTRDGYLVRENLIAMPQIERLRALPTQPGCTIRRLLLFGYSPAWQKPSIYGAKPADGLTAQLL